jgi:hypothetical protein
MNNDKKKMKRIVGAVEYTTSDGEKKARWTQIGVAFENRDGSWNLRFEYLPTRPETTIQLRDFDPKEDERTVPPQLA